MEEVLGFVCGWVFDYLASGDAAADLTPVLAEGAAQVWEQAEAQQPGLLQQSLEALAGMASVARVVARVVEKVCPDSPPEVKQKAAQYLSQVPAQVRRSLRRPGDPTGRTVPPYLSLRRAEDLIPFLPPRLPRFQPGQRPLAGVDLELVELLGVGGFGEVWKAKNPHLASAEPVALKFCLDPQATRILRHEAAILDRVMSKGKHPGIIQLRHTYLYSDPPCLEYELVEGGDLGGLILEWHASRKGVAPAEAARVMLRLAEVVGFAHSQNPPIVHRDLKPANVLVHRGSDGRMKLRVADFGIGGVASRDATEAAAGGRPASLMATLARGSYTPLYASPQQARGGGPDPRDDVYALGVIWHQLLTGDLNAGAPSGVRWSRSLLEAGVPAGQVALLGECLEPRAEDRPATAAEFAGRLKACLRTAPPPAEVPVRPAAPAGPGRQGGRELTRPQPGPPSPAADRVHQVRLHGLLRELGRAHGDAARARRKGFALLVRNLLALPVSCVGGVLGFAAGAVLSQLIGAKKPEGVIPFAIFAGLLAAGVCWPVTLSALAARGRSKSQLAEKAVEGCIGRLREEYPEAVFSWGGMAVLDSREAVEELIRETAHR